MSRLRKVAHPGSLIFMLSDFREMNATATSHLANIARHNDIVLIHISDQIEYELPRSGFYKFSDGQNEVCLNTADRNLRNNYLQHFKDHLDTLETLCRQNRMNILTLTTHEDVLDSLQNGLGANTKTRFTA